MGHSSIQVTVDTYGHLIPGADIAGSTDLMGKLLSNKVQPSRNQWLRARG